jgi:hypothetical protein
MVPLFATKLFDLSISLSAGPNIINDSMHQSTGFGFISKINSYMVKIMWRNYNDDIQYAFISIGDLDHQYYWIPMMRYRSEYQICFQYTLDHNITDIKLCGICCNISGTDADYKFGFIRHAIFYDNLYFRFECVDIKSVAIGDWVAFRVGKRHQHGKEYYWAKSVYKL